MNDSVTMVEVWRGPILESLHSGHAVICNGAGEIVESWGDPAAVILPRSSCKMIQALPLVESGAADAHGLNDERLALACASHNGAPIHTARVERWLADLGLGDADLRCGPQEPPDTATRDALIRAGRAPCQYHNNCSGKHTGFLTLARHLGAGPEYVNPGHPVQRAVLEAFEDVTGEPSPGFGLDGCSAPNFATTLHGFARALAAFANAGDGSVRGRAMRRLFSAMTAHPDLVAGEGCACTELMRVMGGKVAVKTGAEGVFGAILPERGLGVALKIVDGATRASECAIAAILVRLGVLDPGDPVAQKYLAPPVANRRDIPVGQIRPVGGRF